MYTLLIPNTYCKMVYTSSPADSFVADFTQRKQNVWGLARHSIDDFIRHQILDHIHIAVGLAPAVIKTVTSIQFHDRLKARIDAEVNRGLAIIAHSPDVRIYGNSPYKIVDEQTFGNAMRLMLSDFLNLSKAQCRLRVNRSVGWADACAYNIMRSTANKLVRR